MLRLGIDTGGTFTDLVLRDESCGASWYAKTLSTPSDPHRAALDGIERLASIRPFTLAGVEQVLVATTVATNAILERKGGRTALVTTRGFRDVLVMGRAKRFDTYDLWLDKPRPLVPRRAIHEVDERVADDGEVLRPLDIASVHAAADRIAGDGVESVAVCLLHAYANPAHERAVGAILAERLAGPPSRNRAVSISLSSDVSPRRREYERTSTVVANAYVKPIVARFLGELESALARRGFTGDLHVMQSNGGLTTPALAREYPVNIIESGPAAGVLACRATGAEERTEHLLTFDMGGTTAKVGVVDGGEPVVTSTFEVDGVNLRKWSGLPLDIPAVELIEIGAGGGSIASTGLGIVSVGPESAGAEPGPACYGRGGERCTLTDANLVLGYLDPDSFAGGQIRLDREAADRVVRTGIGEPLGLDPAAAAWGVHRIANANMERALRSMSIERGRDPRDYAMVAFGGAGPLHACELARALGVPRVIVPRGAGVASAIGLLEAERSLTVARTRTIGLGDAAAGTELAGIYSELEARTRELFGDSSPPAEWRRHAHLRYAGQGFELRVPLPPGPVDERFLAAARETFDSRYEAEYGYAQRDQPVEGTDWFLTGRPAEADSLEPDPDRERRTGPAGGAGSLDGAAARREGERGAPQAQTSPGGLRHGAPSAAGAGAGTGAAMPEGEGSPPRRVRLAPARVTSLRPIGAPGREGEFECPVYDRDSLCAGDRISGPAIVVERESTLLLPTGDSARVSRHGNLLIDVDLSATQRS